jgi:hypothetical protein
MQVPTPLSADVPPAEREAAAKSVLAVVPKEVIERVQESVSNAAGLPQDILMQLRYATGTHASCAPSAHSLRRSLAPSVAHRRALRVVAPYPSPALRRTPERVA